MYLSFSTGINTEKANKVTEYSNVETYFYLITLQVISAYLPYFV